ncbi:hypothetical protein [Dyadobacter psychrotolerans]|uniref:Uncharacterized protein n=1 Tax=Dyadobacter psychrotolerans TaxID=2541721 RepID=A0A4R5DQ16_9BACT|nr:hypothetical protein [Dyadobacter psychrotolerans]TDE16436.1 hypothetical protein E0F88_09355 [Dyadobacter psychrotolerans]
MNEPTKYRVRFGMFPFFALIAALVLGAAVMVLWNAILPELTGVRTIRYWQAVGLLALCRILLGNFGGRMGRAERWKNHWNKEMADPSEQNANRYKQWGGKWMNMSDEERLHFKDEIRRRCGKPPRDKNS